MISELISMIEYFILKLVCTNSEKSVNIRRKRQIYTHLVKSTWNQALARSISKATAGKPYWYVRHDVAGSDRLYHSLALPLPGDFIPWWTETS